MTSDRDELRVERGMLLLHRDADGIPHKLPLRYRLWTVTRVRSTRAGANVTLIGYVDGIKLEATAAFPDGLVLPPFQHVAFTYSDLARLWVVLEQRSRS